MPTPQTGRGIRWRSPEGPFLRKLWQSGREQWRRFAVGGFLLWAVYTVLLSPGGAIHLFRLQRDSDRLQARINQLAATCDSLDTVLEAIENRDPMMLERVAREEFGYARPNERIYVVAPDATDRRLLDRARLGGTGEAGEAYEGRSE